MMHNHIRIEFLAHETAGISMVRHKTYCKFPGSESQCRAQSSSTIPHLATRMVIVFTAVDRPVFLRVACRRGADELHRTSPGLLAHAVWAFAITLNASMSLAAIAWSDLGF